MVSKYAKIDPTDGALLHQFTVKVLDRASYGLSPSGEADILRPIREDGFRQSPTETMYEVSVQN